jgi:hypothetical protein
MAYKVSGTTVINNSRGLENITSVDSATATAIGNAGIGGDVNISVTAGSSITQYEPVYYDPATSGYVNLDATFGTNILPFTDAQYNGNYNVEYMAYNPDSDVLLHLTPNNNNLDIWRWDDGSGNYCKYQDLLDQPSITQQTFHSFGYNITGISIIYIGSNEFLVALKSNTGYNSWGELRARVLYFDGSSSTGTWRGSGWTQIGGWGSSGYMNGTVYLCQDKKYPNNFIWSDGSQQANAGGSIRGGFRPFKLNRSTYAFTLGTAKLGYFTRYSGTNYSTDYSRPVYHNGRFLQCTIPYYAPGGYPYGYRFKYIQINTSDGTSYLQGNNSTIYHLMVPPSPYTYHYHRGISTGMRVLNDDIIFAGGKVNPSDSNRFNINLWKMNFSGGAVSFGTSVDTGIQIDTGYGYFAMPTKEYINGTEQDIYIDGMDRNATGTKAAVYRWNGSTWSLVETKSSSITDLYNTSSPVNDAHHLQMVSTTNKYQEPIYNASTGSVSAFINFNNATVRPYQFQGYNLTDYSFAGFAQSTVSSGQALNVRLFGVTNTTKSNLIKGQFYTVNDFGDFVLATADNTGYGTALGKAISNTQMLAGLQG